MARVLLIDQDMTESGALASGLVGRGHVVSRASDGAIGLARALAEHYDLVVTDVLVPRRDGLEIISELRDLRPALPVVARTAGDTELEAGDLLDLARFQGAAGSLSKRIDLDTTLRYLARWLGDERDTRMGGRRCAPRR